MAEGGAAVNTDLSLIFDHISTFSGIGGFDLASEWMGWRNIASCEINPFGRRVLQYYWPNAVHHDDIHTFKAETILNEIIKKTGYVRPSNRRILSGGFPCQPYSQAGKRLGKEDSRHLWPQMRRTIREFQPGWVVGENVRGLTNWNGGMVFNEVQADLEAEGYEVTPFLLPAAGVNAPHRRDRVWFIAYSRLFRQAKSEQQSMGSEQLCESGIITDTDNTGNTTHGCGDNGSESEKISKREKSFDEHNGLSNTGINTNSNGYGQQHGDSEHEVNAGEGREYAQHDIEPVCYTSDTIGFGLEGGIQTGEHEGQRQQVPQGRTISEYLHESRTGVQFQNFPTQSPLCGRNDGISSRLDASAIFNKPCKPNHARLYPKWRNESIKAGGNAVVPQVPFQIFQAIHQYELLHP